MYWIQQTQLERNYFLVRKLRFAGIALCNVSQGFSLSAILAIFFHTFLDYPTFKNWIWKLYVAYLEDPKGRKNLSAQDLTVTRTLPERSHVRFVMYRHSRLERIPTRQTKQYSITTEYRSPDFHSRGRMRDLIRPIIEQLAKLMLVSAHNLACFMTW